MRYSSLQGLNRQHLAERFHAHGIRTGDRLLVHSSLKALGPIDGGGQAVLEAFLDVLTPSGLLAMPTHTWAVVNDRQPVFHQRYTPSHVGTLTNLLRLHPGAIRSLHPTHSVAAWGDEAKTYLADHQRDMTPCSPTSPYARLLERGGKVVLLGVDLRACTFFHCLEEMAGLGDLPGELASLEPVSRKRYLMGDDGSLVISAIRGHRNHRSDHYGRIESELVEEGILSWHSVAPAARLGILDAVAAADWLIPRLKENPRFFWPLAWAE